MLGTLPINRISGQFSRIMSALTRFFSYPDPQLSVQCDNVALTGLLNFGSRGRLPVIQQTEAAECGLACLAMVSSYHGRRVDLNTLRRRHPVSLNGVTLKGIIHVASEMQLACRPLRFELDNLRQLRLPAIVHW